MSSSEISLKLKNLLREIVILQDQGNFDVGDLNKAGYELSFLDTLMNAVDVERMRMHHEGLDVYVRDANSERSFIIGLEPLPYKPVHK